MKSLSLTCFCLLFVVNFTDAQTTSDNMTCHDTLTMSSHQHTPVPCVSNDNCTGLSCEHSTLHRDVIVDIDRCTDPLQYHVYVYNTTASALIDHQLYSTSNSTASFQTPNSRMMVHVGRNASHAHFMVTTGTGTVMVPRTTLYLNVSDCMCRSMTSEKENLEIPVEHNCVTDSECVGVECDLFIDRQTFFVDTEVFPCSDPPGVLFVVEPKGDPSHPVFERFFDHSESMMTLLNDPFNVTVTQLPYSIIIHGVLLHNETSYNVIPRTHIILDKEDCIEPTSIAPTGTGTGTPSRPSLPPTESPSGIGPETCDGLKRFANAASNLGTCSTNKQCNTIDCDTVNGDHITLVILPCNDPPALHTIVTNPKGVVTYNGIITNRTVIPVGPFGISFIIVVHDEPGDMAVEVLFHPVEGVDLPFLPETSIPIDNCQCIPSNSVLPSSCQNTSSTIATVSPSMIPGNHTSDGNRTSDGFLHSTSGVVIISVVMSFVMLIVIFATVFGIVICVLRIKKRTSGYSFRRMRIGVEDEEDDSPSNL